jgi:hypothetical protein
MSLIGIDFFPQKKNICHISIYAIFYHVRLFSCLELLFCHVQPYLFGSNVLSLRNIIYNLLLYYSPANTNVFAMYYLIYYIIILNTLKEQQLMI